MGSAAIQKKGLHRQLEFLGHGRPRIFLAWVFSIVLVLLARDYPTWPGIAVCFVGAALRYWASGYLRKESSLAVGGPFAWTRNPLYLGTYIMAVGTAISIEEWVFVALVSVLFAVVYHFVILHEEEKLKVIFGQKFDEYCKNVNRFFPNFIPLNKAKKLELNANAEHIGFSHSLANQNKAYEAFASFAGLIGGVYLIAYLWSEFAPG